MNCKRRCAFLMIAHEGYGTRRYLHEQADMGNESCQDRAEAERYKLKNV
jgi:hypothetical protein